MIISVRDSTSFIPWETFIGLLPGSNWTRTLAVHYIKMEQFQGLQMFYYVYHHTFL